MGQYLENWKGAFQAMKHPLTRRLPQALCALALCAGLLAPALAAEEAETPAFDVTWETLEAQVKANNLTAQALQKNIESIQALNYDALKEDMKDQLNGLANLEFFYAQTNNTLGQSTIHQNYKLLKEQFEALRDGNMQRDNEDVIRQIENGTQQLVAGAQSLYLGLVQMKDQLADVDRGLATLDRSLTELRLRRTLGQVSDQTVREVENTRAGVVSQRKSLESAISQYTIQLQILVGAELTGEMTLGPIPQVTAADLETLDEEAGLASAKEASWALREAQITLDDAEETWKDAKKDYAAYTYRREMANRTWEAAQITYQSSVASYEASFKTLCDSLRDKAQTLANKEEAAAHQEQVANIAQRRYDLGLISRNSLLSAQDDLSAARSEVESARLALFTAYNDYQNAVSYGILN